MIWLESRRDVDLAAGRRVEAKTRVVTCCTLSYCREESHFY